MPANDPDADSRVVHEIGLGLSRQKSTLNDEYLLLQFADDPLLLRAFIAEREAGIQRASGLGTSTRVLGFCGGEAIRTFRAIGNTEGQRYECGHDGPFQSLQPEVFTPSENERYLAIDVACVESEAGRKWAPKGSSMHPMMQLMNWIIRMF